MVRGRVPGAEQARRPIEPRVVGVGSSRGSVPRIGCISPMTGPVERTSEHRAEGPEAQEAAHPSAAHPSSRDDRRCRRAAPGHRRGGPPDRVRRQPRADREGPAAGRAGAPDHVQDGARAAGRTQHRGALHEAPGQHLEGREAGGRPRVVALRAHPRPRAEPRRVPADHGPRGRARPRRRRTAGEGRRRDQRRQHQAARRRDRHHAAEEADPGGRRHGRRDDRRGQVGEGDRHEGRRLPAEGPDRSGAVAARAVPADRARAAQGDAGALSRTRRGGRARCGETSTAARSTA